MNSNGLQQNFILFLEKTKETKEAPRNFNGRLCCEKCRFSTKDTALFERHVAQHEEVTFSCTICNHVSYSRVESQRHLVKHKGSFPYKCSWCTYGAVRRDYMVKHIQRIHGKSAEGIFMTDCTKKNTGLGLGTPRTLGGPSHDVKVVSHLAGNVSNILSSASQTRPSAPYHVTSTTCDLPIVKSQPHLVPGTTYPVSKFTQGIFNPPNVAVKEVDLTVGKAIEYIEKMTEKKSLEKTAVTDALSRVKLGLFGDCAVQQKPTLQSQVVGTTEKAAIPSKILPKIQVGYQVSNTNHLKTLLSNQREAPAAQKSVITGAEQNISVAQRSVPFLASPTTIVERFRQGASPVKQGAQPAGKNSQHRTRPNILVKTPPMPLVSNAKSGVQVGMLAPLNQPIPHNRALMVSGPEERTPSRSSVQVELLAPLNQPIQHNRPLTVSCPEEITIPAGCLVELVEVKNVNGTRELELRLVPQQLTGPQQGDLQSTSVAATTNRLSFKCRVATDANQPISMNTSKASAIPEYLVQGSHVKKFSSDDKVNVKNEAEVNEKLLSTRKDGTQAPGSSGKGFHAVSRSASSNPSDSHKFTQQLRAERKNVAADPVRPLSHMHCTVKNMSSGASDQNIKAEGPKYELRAAQPSSNKQEVAESSYQGLPVISSVFSLCPIPQNTWSQIQPRKKAQMSVVSGSQESIKNTANPKLCSPTLKTEDETIQMTNSVQKYGQLAKTKDEILEEPKALTDMANEKIDAKPEKTFANDEEDKSSPEICSSLTDSPQTAPTARTKDEIVGEPKAPEDAVNGEMDAKPETSFANDEKDKSSPEMCSSLNDPPQTTPSANINSSSVSTSDFSTQSEKVENVESEKSLLEQSDGPLASSLNPIVALIRMPNLEVFANKVQERQGGEESVTARPVVCCMPNQENLQERTIKLVLKRKWSETKTAQDQQTGLLCIDVPPMNKKAKKEKKRAKKLRSSQDQQLLWNGPMGLMPRKDNQLVKRPGPNQPVVVLNHPNPLVRTVSVEGPALNYQPCITPASDLCNQDGTTVPIAGKTCPAFKLTLKKVQGQNYQVTELLLKGVAENPVL